MTDADPPFQTSYSDIMRASWCARAWWLGSYRSLRQIKPKRTGPLPFGARVHLVLEACGLDQDWAEETIERRWNAATEHEWDYVKTRWGYNPDDDMVRESKMGHAMLTNFVHWREEVHWEAKWQAIDVEHQYGEWIPVKMPDGPTVQMLFRGKSDVRERRIADGAVSVLDWKTAANLAPSTLDKQELSIQGPTYLWLEILENDAPHLWGVSYVMLRKVMHTKAAKPPFYARLDVPIGKPRLRAAQRNIIAKTARVLEMKERLDHGVHPDLAAPYTAGWWCGSCPFKAPCGLMQRGYEQGAAEMLDTQFEVGDPFERYNEDMEAVNALM